MKQSKIPCCDYFVELRVGKEKLSIPCGRLWSHTCRRTGSTIVVIVRYRDEQYSYHSFNLPSGI